MASPFGDTFMWGSASSAHQVEGWCTNNSWSRFEQERDPAGNPRIAQGQRVGNACEQWLRYLDDIALMKSLSLNSYRFSIEWSKVEPREGEFDDTALAHYAALIDALCTAGIEPMVTLHHFTDPLWFADRGGFLSDESHRLFARYARHVVDYLHDKVRLWCTINEPTVYAISGYVTGEFPPAMRNPVYAGRVLANMLRAHGTTYVECKAAYPELTIGMATSVFLYAPYLPLNPLDRIACTLANVNLNTRVIAYLTTGKFLFSFPGVVRIKQDHGFGRTHDFVGVNYYTRFVLRFNPFLPHRVTAVNHRDGENRTDMGWEIYPDGFRKALRMVASETAMPMYVTENGIADVSDSKRRKYILDHLCALTKAREDGLDVRGYYYWTLLDNFEWAHGYNQKFGLYHVDFQTQQRTCRKGSEVLGEFIRGEVVCQS